MAKLKTTSPVGRLVEGSLYKENTTDAEGNLLVTKTGPNAGKPRVEYYFAVAIAKGAESHWSQTAWGQIILQAGATAFPQAYQSPAFAWKVKDGDSTVVNRKGKRPCDKTGFPGHWVITLSSGFKPPVYKARDGVPGAFDIIPQDDFVKTGYFVQVEFEVDGNGSAQQPGVYINHTMVCFSAFGDPIASSGRDVAAAGFGQSPLPAGATLVPPAGAFAQAAPALAAPAMGLPQLPGAVPQLQGVPQLLGANNAPIGLPQMAATPAAPQYMPGPAMPPGQTRESLNAMGYADAALEAAGYIVRAPAAPAGLPGLPQLGAAPGLGMPGLPQLQAAPGPLAPGFSAPGNAAFAAPIAGAPAIQIPVIPNPAFTQVPNPAAAAPQLAMPGLPQMGMPVAAAGPILLPKAQQVGFQSWPHMQQQGWDEMNARAQGYIQ